MKWWIRIPAEWQFGQVAALDARPGALRQALARAIERHLLGPAPGSAKHLASAPSSAPQPPQDDAASLHVDAIGDLPRKQLQALIDAFGQQIMGFKAAQPQTQALWQGLHPEVTVEDPTRPDTWLTTFPARMFCLTLHGLCWSLATGQLEAQAQAAQATPADEGGNESDDLDDEALPG